MRSNEKRTDSVTVFEEKEANTLFFVHRENGHYVDGNIITLTYAFR